GSLSDGVETPPPRQDCVPGVESGLEEQLSGRRTMTIDLDKETQRLIDQELRAGRFRDAAAFVGAAVRHFLITRGDLGYTREEIFAELEREERELQRQRG